MYKAVGKSGCEPPQPKFGRTDPRSCAAPPAQPSSRRARALARGHEGIARPPWTRWSRTCLAEDI